MREKIKPSCSTCRGNDLNNHNNDDNDEDEASQVASSFCAAVFALQEQQHVAID